MMDMKVACTLLPNFETAVELLRRPELAGRPVVVGGLPHERKTVRSRSPEAAAYGVAEGMPLRHARGLCPEAAFLPLDEELYRATLDTVLRVLDGFSPTVELEGGYSAPGNADGRPSPPARGGNLAAPTHPLERPLSIYLDASRLERLFGPEERLGRRIAAAVEQQTGLRPRVGLGGSKFVARAAALRAAPGSALVVKGDEERAFLAPLPVELLPCSEEMRRRLHLLGLGTLGQLAALPAGALAEQFGPEGVEAYRLARGIDDRPLAAREVPLLLEEEMEVDPPADRADLLLSAASSLIERLVARMRSDYLACRQVALHLGFADGSALRSDTTLHEPAEGGEEITRAVGRLLERVPALTQWTCHMARPLGEGAIPRISSLRVSLSGFSGRHGEQMELFRTRAGGLRKVHQALRQMGEQFGEGSVRSLAELAGERARPRPLRVIADAAGRPQILLLGGRLERVLEVCNRWRVREDWWRREIYRDYYRLITESGRLCVVSRDLTSQPPSPAGKGESSTPWFLEKLYG